MAVRPLAMGEQIARQLRIGIITGEIPHGTHLIEDALAEQFDVSRGPIRDALRRLQSEGLVESRRKWLYTRALGLEGIEELYELREALETLAIRLAVERASSREWDGVQRIVDRMRRAGEADDNIAFASADMDFHTSFYELSGNKRLLEAWRPYQNTFSILLEMSDTPDIPASTADHQGFLDVVRTGDADAAVKRLRLHLTLAKAHVRDAVRGVGDPVG